MPGAWLHSMSLAISWGVACCQQHSAYCMLRSIDSVCINVNLRALRPTAGRDRRHTARSQSHTRTHRVARPRRDTPRHRPLEVGSARRARGREHI